MAGVKGKSGGARPNSGGARPGAGRPPKEAEILNVPSGYDDPLKFLTDVMNDVSADARLRADAAKALMPYMHKRLGEAGKKEEAADAAKKAGNKFAVQPPPLKLVGGK